MTSSVQPAMVPAHHAESPSERPPTGTVALVFSDLQDSTPLWEKAYDAMARALEQHNRLLRELMRHHGGYEVSNEGDAFFVVFADPIAAVRWCFDAQVALQRQEWPEEIGRLMPSDPETGAGGLRVRMGVHVGQPRIERSPVTNRFEYIGPATNRAARIASAAHGGQILLSETAWEAVREPLKSQLVHRDFGEVRLKGLERRERLTLVMPRTLAKRLQAEAEKKVAHRDVRPVAAAAVNRMARPAAKPSLERVRDVLVLLLCLVAIVGELYIIARYASSGPA